MNERAWTSLTNPFPGLRAFSPGDSHLFFGRNLNSDEVINRLLQNRLVSVIGASGSGKSSLVLSGVIPRLLATNAEGKRSWSYLVLRPNFNPVESLATEISALSAAAGFAYVSPQAALNALQSGKDGLAELVSRIRKNLRQQVILVIDQFEDIYRFNNDTSRPSTGDNVSNFINLIIEAAKQEDTGLYIIITMQADYISECARHEGLIALMNTGSYLIPQIKGEGYSILIEEPLKITGTPIDSKLVKTIILEAGNKTGQLPLIQHMLMRLWDQWIKCGDSTRSIGLTDYEAIGRLEGAISSHAGQAYAALSPLHQDVCERLFRCITYCGPDKKGQRKPEKLSVIHEMTGCSIEDLTSVIELFRSPGYSFLTPPVGIPLTPDTVIDVTHESIITSWDLLRKWVEDEEDAQKMYLRLAYSASCHQEGKAPLWVPPELTMALKWRNNVRPTVAWAEKIDPAYERTMLFLKASEIEFIESEETKIYELHKKTRWARRAGILFAVTTLISITLVGNYLSEKAVALRGEALAMEQKNRVIEINRHLSDSLTVTVKSKQEIEADAIAAKSRALLAQQEAQIAGRTAGMAVRAMKDAETKAGEASRKRMISVGKSLAVRSFNFQDNLELQSLLAYQGYVFNTRFEGPANDADIYSAFYAISKKIGNRYYSVTETGNRNYVSMAMSPDGKFLFTSDKNGNVLQWNGTRPDLKGKTILSGNRIISALAVSPDGTWLACGTDKSRIIMLPLTEGPKSYELNGEEDAVFNSLAYSHDGRILYGSTHDGEIAEWHFAERMEKSYRLSDLSIKYIDISPDNKMLAALSSDGKAVIVPTDFSSQPRIIGTGEDRITAMGFVPWNNRILLGHEAGLIEIWDFNESRAVDIVEAHKKPVMLFAFSPEIRQMASASSDGVIKLWSEDTMIQPPVTITDNSAQSSFLGYTTSGLSFLAANSNGTITQRPAQVALMAGPVCSNITRNLTPEEWEAYVGEDIPYEKTCDGHGPKIKVNHIESAQ
jgi:WD40 repeat protein